MKTLGVEIAKEESETRAMYIICRSELQLNQYYLAISPQRNDGDVILEAKCVHLFRVPASH